MTEQVQTQLTQEDIGILEGFRKKAIEFRDAFVRLESNRAYAMARPDLADEFEGLHENGSVILSTVEYITRTVDAATGFFSDAWAAASSTFKRFFGLGAVMVRPPQNLGFIPIIAGATIAGSVAVMGKWVRDVYLFERKVTEQKRLESEGLTPAEAAALVAQTGGGGGLLDELLGDVKAPLLVLGGGVLLYHFFLRRPS